MAKISPTNETTNAILRFLFNAGIYSYRQNSLGVPIPGTGRFRSAPKTGLPDIVTILPPNGKHLGIEVKTGSDRLRPEQVGTLENIKRMGGAAFVVKDFEDFKSQFETITSAQPELRAYINQWTQRI